MTLFNIYTAKPGVVIDDLALVLRNSKRSCDRNFTTKQSLNINIKEVERPSLSAALVLQGVISDLERRVPFDGQ